MNPKELLVVEPNKVKVIIIDDDPMTIFLSTKILQLLDSNIVTASFLSGKEAFSFFKENNKLAQAVILLDINMPIYNGWDFLNDFVTIDSACKIWMFTSSIDRKDIDKSKTYPVVNGFLSKPLTPEKIQKIITESFE